MALLGNYSVLNKNPGRALGGSTVSDTRAQYNKAGPSRNQFVGWAGMVGWLGTPVGARPPVSWIIAIDDGGMAAHSGTGLGTGTVTMAGGKAIVADGSGTGSGTAVGALVVQVIGTGSGTGSGVGVIFASLAIIADGSGTGAGTVNIDALGQIVAHGIGLGAGVLNLDAIGQIIATNGATVELTADQVATAVWSTTAAGTAGTMGEALAVAHLLLRNKTITDPAAGTITVYDTDGTTVLFVADLFEDAAGTTAYTGAGAERRERLA